MKRLLTIGAMFSLTLPAVINAESLQLIATNGTYGAARNLGSGAYDPAAGSAGKTFVTWAGPEMDIWARAYDHASNTWETAVRVMDNNWSRENDYHNYPVIILAPNGKLLIFQIDHNYQMYMFTPSSVGSLSGTWARTTVIPAGEGPAYPTPVVAGGTVYFFYRSRITDTYRTLRYIKSTDNGATWSNSRAIIDTNGQQAGDLNTVYIDEAGYEGAVSGRPARIRIVYHLAGGAFNNEKTKNIYFAYLHTNDDSMHAVDGSSLGTVIDGGDFANEESNRIRVFLSLPTTSNPKPVEERNTSRPISSQAGRPLVGFNHNSGDGTGWKAYTATWNGSNWLTRRMMQGSAGIGGRLMDFQYVNSTAVRAILVDGTSIRGKETSDQGATWTQVWDLNASAMLIDDADRFTYVNVIEGPGRKVQALGATHRYDTRKTDYTGHWGVFVVKD